MLVVLAGASGTIGAALGAALRAEGHQVKQLVRHDAHGDDVDSWDPGRGLLDPDFLTGADAVVCLSGIGVAGRRWTEAYKKQIVDSRVDSVATVARTLAEMTRQMRPAPKVLIAASAVGYYGDTGDRTVTEEDPPGSSFLADVCVRWEAAAAPARAAGVRVAHLRTGLVLAKGAGLLKPLSLAVKAGVGGKLGSGEQYMPWVSLTDEVAAIRFLLERDVEGPVNVTAPTPARNVDFVHALGRVLARPTVLPVPAIAARLALGEFAGEVLGGQRAVPHRLLDAGFHFAHTELEPALRAVLS